MLILHSLLSCNSFFSLFVSINDLDSSAPVCPAFRPLRSHSCRERREAVKGKACGRSALDARIGSQARRRVRFAPLTAPALLPAVNACERGTEMPPAGACSGNITQRQNRERQDRDFFGFYRITPCIYAINALEILFALFHVDKLARRANRFPQGVWKRFSGTSSLTSFPQSGTRGR